MISLRWIGRVLTRLDPLVMNAFNTVNLSAAVIVTSTEFATQIGIPKDKWVYVLGGAGTHEKENCKKLLLTSIVHIYLTGI